MRYLGCVALSATCMLAMTAGAKPPQQAEPVTDAATQAKMKLQQQLLEKAGLVGDEGAAPGGFALRGPCPNTAVRTPALGIIDNSTVFDTMSTAGDPLSNVKVELNILHTWQGDVTVSLRHEASGTEVTLINRPGNPQSTFGFSNDNYGDNGSGIPFVLDDSAATTYDVPQVAAPGITNVTGSWLPDDPFFQTLAAFNGLTANTTWTLSVTDSAGGDQGTVVRWAICSDNALGTSQLSATGSAAPPAVVSGDNVVLNVQVTPAVAPPSTGITVVADLSQIGGSASQSFTDMGGNLFSHTQMVSAPFGAYSLPFTATDAEARFVAGNIAVTVVPSNDNCPGEVVTAPSNTFGTTTGTTPSGNVLCGVNSRDVFYNFTPTVSGEYTIDTCGTTWDTRLSVFTDCPAASMVGCNDDACGLQSRLILNLDANTTYYIRVSAFALAGGGDFVLNISAPPIPTGGCCIAGVCSVSTEADCNNAGGDYLGDNTGCPSANFTASSSPNLPILDNSTATTDIVIAAGETITDLDVGLFITHTFQGDVSVALEHVDTGTFVTLISRPGQPQTTFGFGNDNYGDAGTNTPFVLDDSAAMVYDVPNVAAPGINNVSGSWLPDTGPLSAFNGLNSAGTWRLHVSDSAAGDIGTLTFWGLIVNGGGGSNPCDDVGTCPADWDGNNTVEVNDIFAFLGDWFASIPAATNFGGTPGVPAIFAYLTAWFAHGIGPC
ncbi:MAG: proprotein convertase P-domain-containing protein [Phycisphaeraceae bacterium]|nr:proprotein convertase P-domain-containing protein [Phycisphaeraceae bacterium]